MKLNSTKDSFKEACLKSSVSDVYSVFRHSNGASGWRPVCRGKFIGSSYFDRESEAIRAGKNFVLSMDKCFSKKNVRHQEINKQKSRKSFTLNKYLVTK